MQVNAAELEQRAERAVRRGELLSAIEHFESYLAHHPDDERVRQRMESVRALLQPSELVSRRRAEPEEPQGPSADSLSLAEQGEMHASSGRFSEAMQAYERAVAENPRNDLLRERLDELRELSGPGAGARADLDGAEKLDALTPARGVPPVAARSARASEAVFAPLEGTGKVRKDPVALLEELLARVRTSRRPRA